MKNLQLMLLGFSLFFSQMRFSQAGTSSGGGADGETNSTTIFSILEYEGFSIVKAGAEKIISFSELTCKKHASKDAYTYCEGVDDANGKQVVFKLPEAARYFLYDTVILPPTSNVLFIKKMFCSQVETFGVQDTRCWVYQSNTSSPTTYTWQVLDPSDLTCKLRMEIEPDQKKRSEFLCESSLMKFNILCNLKGVNAEDVLNARYYHIVKGYKNAGPAILNINANVALIPCDYKK